MDEVKAVSATSVSVEQGLVSAGQRRVNILWESTQAVIAVLITGAVIYNAINGIQSEVLTNAFFLIVSMYFVRTNHTKMGGIEYPNGFRR